MFGKVMAPFASVWEHLKEVGGLRDPSKLSIEDFRLELAELGLLGKGFGPDEYRAALEEHLGIEIHVENLPDLEGGAFAGELAAGGILAEVIVEEESGNAVVLVWESLRDLPWPAFELAVFHELSHLAAGHPLRVKRRARGKGARMFRAMGPRLASREAPTVTDVAELDELKGKVLEPEARKRAKWLVAAGTVPKAFEGEKANRLT